MICQRLGEIGLTRSDAQCSFCQSWHEERCIDMCFLMSRHDLVDSLLAQGALHKYMFFKCLGKIWLTRSGAQTIAFPQSWQYFAQMLIFLMSWHEERCANICFQMSWQELGGVPRKYLFFYCLGTKRVTQIHDLLCLGRIWLTKSGAQYLFFKFLVDLSKFCLDLAASGNYIHQGARAFKSMASVVSLQVMALCGLYF